MPNEEKTNLFKGNEILKTEILPWKQKRKCYKHSGKEIWKNAIEKKKKFQNWVTTSNNTLAWNEVQRKGPKLAKINHTEIPKPGNKSKWNTGTDIDEMTCLIKSSPNGK